MKPLSMNVVHGGQAGSEAKGKLASFLAHKFGIKVFACNLSPNAGHTVIKDDGTKIVTHHIPVGVAGCRWPDRARVILGPASVINLDTLVGEIAALQTGGVIDPKNIIVDARASVILPSSIKEEEKSMLYIGSTAQGVGITRSDRIMRKGACIGDFQDILRNLGVTVRECTNEYLMLCMIQDTVLYEMGQGFDLCLDHGVDRKYCTSRNCTPMQAMADMGIPNKLMGHTYAVVRTYPIRVNNRTGSSGPYPSEELTWEEIGRRCHAPHDITEKTTTTKLVRRVFEFAHEQYSRMLMTCAPTYVCLQFANYLDWELYDKTDPWLVEENPALSKFIETVDNLHLINYIGTGPSQSAMIDRGWD